MMQRVARYVGYTVFGWIFFNLLCVPSPVWGSLRVGNAEMQLFYAQNHQFQYDSNGYGINWVQFRNELSFKFTYTKLIDNGQLFEQINIPYVYEANFYAYYRGRYDPIYQIRKRYRRAFDNETVHNFIVPENEFREFFMDVDFGEVGPGYLSTRIGRQQVVWGESDLFRSLDVINPLKIDQSSLVGERFDDYRTPLWIAKFLYSIGNVGPISEVAVEPFYSANWQPLLADVLAPHALRLRENDLPRFVGFKQPGNPASEPLFRTKGRLDKSFQYNHPWILTKQTGNVRSTPPAFVCVFADKCINHQNGDRIGASFNWEYGHGGLDHAPHGWGLNKSMAGVRMMAKTGFGVDFSLNYLFKRTEGAAHFDSAELLDRQASLATGLPVIKQSALYGIGIPGQDLYTGIARCTGSEKPIRGIPGAPAGVFTSPGYRGAGNRIGNKGHNESAVLVGADIQGFNANDNPDDDIGVSGATVGSLFGLPPGLAPVFGLPVPGLGGLVPVSACGKFLLRYNWTHIAAFTATYNDFDYTGAIFRLEQSYSTKEIQTKVPTLLRRVASLVPCDITGGAPPTCTSRSNLDIIVRHDLNVYSPVWRSMVGFDLIRSWASFPGLGWMRYLPLDIGTQTTFFTAQFLTEYIFENTTNRVAASVGPLCASLNLFDRCTRTNMAFTFAIAGAGYARGRFEPLAAVGYDATTWESIFVYRMFWHHLFNITKLDFYGGTAVYMGSKTQQGWLGLHNFADRDVLWLRLIYYLL